MEEVEEKMSALLEEINVEVKEDDILIVAAYFHAMFEQIHGFADGNGRTGRTLMNYFLMIRDFPPTIIFEEDRTFYYECLEQFDTLQTLDPLVEFLKYELEKTWLPELTKKDKFMKLSSFL